MNNNLLISQMNCLDADQNPHNLHNNKKISLVTIESRHFSFSLLTLQIKTFFSVLFFTARFA